MTLWIDLCDSQVILGKIKGSENLIDIKNNFYFVEFSCPHGNGLDHVWLFFLLTVFDAIFDIFYNF